MLPRFLRSCSLLNRRALILLIALGYAAVTVVLDSSTSHSSASNLTSSSTAAAVPSTQQDHKNTSLPSCIVIGVRKGGTRALLDMVGLHSRVRPARGEVHFFDLHYDEGLEWYRRQMPALSPGQMAVEKTPSYFNTEGVPERVKAMDPRVLLLLVVRDPVTRLVSDYTQILQNHLDRGRTFKSFAEAALNPDGSINLG